LPGSDQLTNERNRLFTGSTARSMDRYKPHQRKTIRF